MPDRDSKAEKRIRSWPVLLLALPAFVAIWSGWVGLGTMTGFGEVQPLPGIADGFTINTAITLPIGMETYASYALHVWLNGHIRTAGTRAYAKWSALGALILGGVGQVAYHLMQAAHWSVAPWPVVVLVACVPPAVLGMGATLAHMISRENGRTETVVPEPVSAPAPLTVPVTAPVPVPAVRKRRTARRDPATVARAVAMRAEGATYTEIGAALGISPSTAAKYAPKPVVQTGQPRPSTPTQPVRPAQATQPMLPLAIPALGGVR
ncbi:helix-turn-helix domain-containing protein [Nocardia brasiliensis]